MNRFRTRCRLRRAAVALACVIVVLQAMSAQAQDSTVVSSVTFRTTDLVYLDQGRRAGVAVGDTVQIHRSDSLIATLVVEHVSSNSASGTILTSLAPVAVGDTGIIAVSNREDTESVDQDIPLATTTTPVPSARLQQTTGTVPLARVNGSLRLAANSWNGEGDARDYTQSLMTANVTAQRIAGRNLTLRFRSNGRRNDRGAGSSVADEWTSNINLFSVEYRPNSGVWGVEAGRFLPGHLGLAGYVDGALIDVLPSANITLGVFGGLTPQWQFASSRDQLRKIGAFTRIAYGTYRSSLIDVRLGALGEYSGAEISREVVFSRGRMTWQRRWSFSHSIELDVNRGWRADREGSSLTLASADAQLRWQTNSAISLHAGYNHYRRTFEDASRTTPDSLFDTRARQRWRVGVQWSLPSQVSLGGEYGFRRLTGSEDRGSSYSVTARKRGLWDDGAAIDLRVLKFTDADADGTDMSLRVAQTVGRGHYLSVGAGRYQYHDAMLLNERDNHWGEVGVRLRLGERLSGDARFRQSAGDDLDGHRIQFGVSYRL